MSNIQFARRDTYQINFMNEQRMSCVQTFELKSSLLFFNNMLFTRMSTQQINYPTKLYCYFVRMFQQQSIPLHSHSGFKLKSIYFHFSKGGHFI